eukprot:COSAG06_NODE_39_length_30337_cov_59.886534_2_plen_76_part_00
MRSVGASPERRSRARRPRAGVRCGAAAAGQRECSGLRGFRPARRPSARALRPARAPVAVLVSWTWCKCVRAATPY